MAEILYSAMEDFKISIKPDGGERCGIQIQGTAKIAEPQSNEIRTIQ
jgi:Holliday junction resolvasome RuvABC ATP-dependent DNA helicase subunit